MLEGTQYYFCMEAHIGVDAGFLVRSMVGMAADVHGPTPVDQLLHDEEAYVHADAGYTRTAEHEELRDCRP